MVKEEEKIVKLDCGLFESLWSLQYSGNEISSL